MLQKGVNEIIVEIDYFQKEEVYYALFGENVTESLKNCLAYDTDIEAVALKGSFGVYGDFKAGKGENIVIGENFRIGKQQTTVTKLIEEGYPFFSGDISLKQTITVLKSFYLRFSPILRNILIPVNLQPAPTLRSPVAVLLKP